MEGELSQKQREQRGFYVHAITTDCSVNWADAANKAIRENEDLKGRVDDLLCQIEKLSAKQTQLEDCIFVLFATIGKLGQQVTN